MIHIVTSANRRAYALQLAEVAAEFGRNTHSQSALAELKDCARPALDDPREAYILSLDAHGHFEFGVALQPSSAPNACHRHLAGLLGSSRPRQGLWECLFLFQRSRCLRVDRPKLAGFWAAVLEAAHGFGATELAGLDLSERGEDRENGAVLREIPCNEGIAARARALAGGSVPVIRLEPDVAAVVSGGEVEQLFGGIGGVGPLGVQVLRVILEQTRALAEAQGTACAVDRIEQTRRSIKAQGRAA